jgi:hypothetical protein
MSWNSNGSGVLNFLRSNSMVGNDIPASKTKEKKTDVRV